MPRKQRNSVRTQARIAHQSLTRIKRAAEIQGRSVSDFVAAAATIAAKRTIAETRIIQLSAHDQRALAAAVLDPPKPTPALRRAFRAYRKLIQASR